MEGKGATLSYAEWFQQQTETSLYYFQKTKIKKTLQHKAIVLKKNNVMQSRLYIEITN
jgi:hypothetical protein